MDTYENREYYRVQLALDNYATKIAWIDMVAYLLEVIEDFEAQNRMLYDDYKIVNGIMVCHKETIKTKSSIVETFINSIEFNLEFDSSIFYNNKL